MKVKMIVCSIVSMSLVASEKAVFRVEPKDLVIPTVTVFAGNVRLERPVTPEKSMIEEDDLLKRPQLQPGPIRKSLHPDGAIQRRAEEAFEARRKELVFKDKLKMDAYEIARKKYLEDLRQVLQAHQVVSSGAVASTHA